MHPDIHYAIHRDQHADLLRRRRADSLVRRVSRSAGERAMNAVRHFAARFRRWKRATTRHALRRGETLSRDAGREPLTLLVEHGCVWATRSGDAEDHLLCSGTSIRIPERSRLALQALATADIEIRHGVAEAAR